MNDLAVSWDVVWRIATAVALGAAIGFERELQDQPAGLRTHVSVALGSCVFGVLSALGFREFEGLAGYQLDPGRVAAQVVVGIGFLGAGVIIREGSSIRNVTTAASLWVTAAVGLAAGLGDIGLAGATAAAILMSLTVLRAPRDAAHHRFARERATVLFRLFPGVEADALVAALHALPDAHVEHAFVEKIGGVHQVRALVVARRGVALTVALDTIRRREDVTDLRDAGTP